MTKPLLLGILIGVILVVIFYSSGEQYVINPSGTDLTGHIFENFNGDSIKINDIADDCVILAFWGTYCAPCLDNIPKLNTFAKENLNISVIYVSHESVHIQKEYLSHFKYNSIKFLRYPGNKYRDLGIAILPHYIYLTKTDEATIARSNILDYLENMSCI